MKAAYPDTSFLVSLYGGDGHTSKAHTWAEQSGAPILVTPLNRFEFGNALRLAVFRKAIGAAEVMSSLDAFEIDLKNGALHLLAFDSSAILAEATRLSQSHTTSSGHRTFDVLHVASAKILKASTFLTFDAKQQKLATAVGLAVGP